MAIDGLQKNASPIIDCTYSQELINRFQEKTYHLPAPLTKNFNIFN